MNRYLLIAPLAVFGAAGAALYWYFIQPDISNPFHDNLVPELIGFCIEGFFLVGLLTWFQQSREHERRRALWLSLRGSLRDILSHLDIAFLSADAEPTDARNLERSPAVIKDLLVALQEHELDLEAMVAVKQAAIEALPLTRDLIPVAAQLSASHMHWWIAISDAMRQASQANERDDLERSVYQILVNLQEFDGLSLH
ncbi:MAG: hypothetical protein AAGA23_21575 [Pseudomonadota bacterium]